MVCENPDLPIKPPSTSNVGKTNISVLTAHNQGVLGFLLGKNPDFYDYSLTNVSHSGLVS